MQVVRLSAWLVLLTVIFVPLERLFALHPKKIFRTAVLTDLAYYFISSLVPSILLTLPLAYVAWYVHRIVPGSFREAVDAWPLGAKLAASLVVGEIGFYWGHRWSHEFPLLWRFHAIHHSAEHVDFLVNTRAHPVDMVFTKLCGVIPLYVIGLAAPMRGTDGYIPLLVILLGTFWGFFIHANVRWRFGPLEWLVATPAFHHWHHTNDGPDVINKNYASMLPWLDRIFGTLYLPKDKQPERYGIDQPMPRSLFGQLVDPFFGPRKVTPAEVSQGHPAAAAPESVAAVHAPPAESVTHSSV